MSALAAYLDRLDIAAKDAGVAEDTFRREIASRTRALEKERAFAFRRVNLMRAVAEGVSSAESEEIAVAAGSAMLRHRLGWSSDSDARSEVLSQFAPVAAALFAARAPRDGDDAEEEEAPDVAVALADFEGWYAATHPVDFWVLFENVMSETPVVDF